MCHYINNHETLILCVCVFGGQGGGRIFFDSYFPKCFDVACLMTVVLIVFGVECFHQGMSLVVCFCHWETSIVAGCLTLYNAPRCWMFAVGKFSYFVYECVTLKSATLFDFYSALSRSPVST